MENVYIIASKRSPIGSFLGTLKDLPLVDYAAHVLKETIQSKNINSKDIDEVIVGQVLSANHGQGVSRQIALKAGLDELIPTFSVNMVCGSGMLSIIQGYLAIREKDANLVVAGGIESMSQSPFYIDSNIRSGVKFNNFELKDGIIKDGLIDAFTEEHMGVIAEKVVDHFLVTREESDLFAYQSHMKAYEALNLGLFKDEIVPIEIKTKNQVKIFENDEHIRPETSLEKLAQLKPIFKSNGIITAGNASGMNDGASFVILASESYVKKHQIKPLAKIISYAKVGVSPQNYGLGIVPAVNKILKNTNLTLDEIDTIELNEAFSIQVLSVVKKLSKELNIDENKILNKINPLGGAIALGHPIGMSGNRIVVTQIHHMLRNKLRYGLSSLCIGGGLGIALLIENASI